MSSWSAVSSKCFTTTNSSTRQPSMPVMSPPHPSLLVPRLRRPFCPFFSPPSKSPFASPQAAADVQRFALLHWPTPQERATSPTVSQCHARRARHLVPSALTQVHALLDTHIADFGLICSLFVCFFIPFFILDSPLVLLAFYSTLLPSDIELCCRSI